MRIRRGRQQASSFEIAREAWSSLAGAAGRNVLASVGTALACGALVAIVGVSQTANVQIDARFSAEAARVVTVLDRVNEGDEPTEDVAFPFDAERRVRALAGGRGSLVSFTVSADPVVVSAHLGEGDGVNSLPVFGASGSLLPDGDGLMGGRDFTDVEVRHGASVALLSVVAARQLQVDVEALPVLVRVDGVAYAAVGIADRFTGSFDAASDLDLGVVIPSRAAVRQFGVPFGKRAATLRAFVQLGAAEQVASQLPLALRPDVPDSVSVIPPVTPRRLSDQVKGDLSPTLALIAAISLVAGAVGIANAASVSVMQRRAEIGLRRALGARRRDIAGQLLGESMAIGSLGALTGSVAGLATVVAVAAARHWTAVIDLRVVPVALVVGIAVGAVGGLWPAVRAAQVDPVSCLKGT